MSEILLFCTLGCSLNGAQVLANQTAATVQNNPNNTPSIPEAQNAAQLLGEWLTQEIQSIRLETEKLAMVHRLSPQTQSPAPEGRILHWAELSLSLDTKDSKNGKKVTGIRQLGRNPLWNGTSASEDSYLHWITQSLPVDQILRNRLGWVKLQKDPHSPQSWISLAFLESFEANQQSILLALLDPTQSLTSFQKWAVLARQNGQMRGYLIGSDGQVLVHSSPALNFADFSRLPFFETLIRSLRNPKLSSSSIRGFESYDHLPVEVGFSKLGSLPVSAVVEVLSPDSSGLKSGIPRFLVDFDLKVLWGILFGLVLGVFFGVTLGIRSGVLVRRKKMTEKTTPKITKKSHDAIPEELLWTRPRPENGPENGKENRKTFSGDDLLILSTVGTPQTTPRKSPPENRF